MPDGIEGHIMQVTYYFLIKPRDTLLRRLQGLPYEWTELLGGPVLWTKTEGDRMLCSREDRYTFVKIVYLASIYNDYKDAPEYNDIFSDLKLDTSFFDMNWTLEEIEEVENVDDVAKELSRTVLSVPIQTGRPIVDQWFKDLLNNST